MNSHKKGTEEMLSYLLQQQKRKKKETRLLDAKYVISMRRISCISDSC